MSLIDARDSAFVVAELLLRLCCCFESARFVIDELRELGVDVVGWRKRASSQRQESLAELAESDGRVCGPCGFGMAGWKGWVEVRNVGAPRSLSRIFESL